MKQESALKIFKSLADTSRLRIVQSLTKGEMYTELLAERLGITPSTVSFHMKKLEDAGIVVSRKEQYYIVYSLNRDVLESSLFDVAAAEPEQIDEQQKREAEYRQKVIDSFFEYGKLRAIPVQRKKETDLLRSDRRKPYPWKSLQRKGSERHHLADPRRLLHHPPGYDR